jgi:hypothetical protein
MPQATSSNRTAIELVVRDLSQIERVRAWALTSFATAVRMLVWERKTLHEGGR